MFKDKHGIKTLTAINFLLLTVIFLLIFGPLIEMNNSVNGIITMLTGFAFMLIHGYLVLGLRNILVFIVITWGFSFCCEAFGVASGTLFGQYFYTNHLGPKILGVPLMIQISYASMGYASLMISRLIIGISGTRQHQKMSLLLTPLIGALLMVGWDLCEDPFESTVAGDWIWVQGGPYFGIGIQNFVGWFVTVFIFMFLYQLYTFYYPEQKKISSRTLWSQPIIYYALIGLDIVLVPWVGGVNEPIASANNYSGSLNDLIKSLSLITVFVMGTPTVIGFARLLTNALKDD